MADITVGTVIGQQDFGIRFGKPDLTAITAVVKSLTAGDITVSLDGQVKTITLTALGTDAPSGHAYFGKQACFVGNATFTGLVEYTKYDWSAAQGGATYTGFTWTNTPMDKDCIVMPICCDNNGNNMPAQQTVSPAGYGHIRKIAEDNPDKPMYIVHVDDHYGYIVRSVIDDSLGTGHTQTALQTGEGTGLMYDFCLPIMAAFGLLSNSVDDGTTALSDGTWGHHEDYIWCMRNVPVLPQWGDWDTGANEMGWLYDTSDTVTLMSPSGLTVNAQFLNAKTVWDAFLKPFQGDAIDGSNSNAWAHTVGCLKIIAPDGISKVSGDGVGGGATWARPTTIWGATQIASLIAATDDTSVPFKTLFLNYAVRFLADTTASLDHQSRGGQNPLGGNPNSVNYPSAAHVDWAALYTDAGGLMTKTSCNGVQGCLFNLHGDDHRALVLGNRNDAGANNEWFYSITVGTITGSSNFNNDAMTIGDTFDGSTVELIDGANFDSAREARQFFVVPLFLYGSRPLKEIEMYFYGRGGYLLKSGKFVEGRGGNDMHSIDSDLNVISSSGASVGGIGL